MHSSAGTRTSIEGDLRPPILSGGRGSYLWRFRTLYGSPRRGSLRPNAVCCPRAREIRALGPITGDATAAWGGAKTEPSKGTCRAWIPCETGVGRRQTRRQALSEPQQLAKAACEREMLLAGALDRDYRIRPSLAPLASSGASSDLGVRRSGKRLIKRLATRAPGARPRGGGRCRG
jgi:hypothetical protein